MSGRLVLIASYPKSGNTWTRLVLQTLQRGAPLSINSLDVGLYGARRRSLFDSLGPANMSELTPGEIDDLCPEILGRACDESDGPLLIKTHDRARRTPSGDWLFPPDRVQAALHIVRHPFDVAVSFANHLGASLDETIRIMAADDFEIAPSTGRLALPLRELSGSWSGHTASWFGDSPYPTVHLRYEDLVAAPGESFARLVRAAGPPFDKGDLDGALASTRFDRLRAEEMAGGFFEKPLVSQAFFREGRPGSGAAVLTKPQRDDIAAAHAPMMEILGYLLSGEILPFVEHPVELGVHVGGD